MRQQISSEGIEPSIPHQIWFPGCHVWDEDAKLPIFLQYSEDLSPGDVIGWGTDIRREDDGRITADIHWVVDTIPPEMVVSVTIYDVEKHWFAGDLFITHGKIKKLFLTDHCPWAPGWDDYRQSITDDELRAIYSGEEKP